MSKEFLNQIHFYLYTISHLQGDHRPQLGLAKVTPTYDLRVGQRASWMHSWCKRIFDSLLSRKRRDSLDSGRNPLDRDFILHIFYLTVFHGISNGFPKSTLYNNNKTTFLFVWLYQLARLLSGKGIMISLLFFFFVNFEKVAKKIMFLESIDSAMMEHNRSGLCQTAPLFS